MGRGEGKGRGRKGGERVKGTGEKDGVGELQNAVLNFIASGYVGF